MDNTLMREFISKFLGYGSFENSFWCVGMEEGGGFCECEIKTRLDVWNQNRQPALLDVVDFHRAVFPDNSPVDRLQKTWSGLIKIFLSAWPSDKHSNDIIHFQQTRLGSSKCPGITLLELFPLPSPGISSWNYGQWSDISFLNSRNSYKKAIKNDRIALLKGIIEEHHPKVIIFYGLSYRRYWEQITSSVFIQDQESKAFFSESENSIYALIKHPARGTSNSYLELVGKQLRERADKKPAR